MRENSGKLRKAENAANLAFSPLSTMFSILYKTNFIFSVTFIMLSANALCVCGGVCVF